MKIVTLATSHNRRKKTIASLSSLYSQKLPLNYTLKHVLVDDGSSDGTTEAIKDNYPDVEILKSNGDLYWAGGMRYGWEASVRHMKFDFLLVYNDDVVFKEDAILSMINTAFRCCKSNNQIRNSVIVGAFLSKKTNKSSYSGLVRCSTINPLKFCRVEPDAKLCKLVDTMNMNGCLIGYDLLKRIGFLEDYFIHGGADFEFGLRVNNNGGKCFLTQHFIGECERNEETVISGNLLQRWSAIGGVKGQPVMQRYTFYRKYGGFFWFYFFIIYYLKIFYYKI